MIIFIILWVSITCTISNESEKEVIEEEREVIKDETHGLEDVEQDEKDEKEIEEEVEDESWYPNQTHFLDDYVTKYPFNSRSSNRKSFPCTDRVFIPWIRSSHIVSLQFIPIKGSNMRWKKHVFGIEKAREEIGYTLNEKGQNMSDAIRFT